MKLLKKLKRLEKRQKIILLVMLSGVILTLILNQGFLKLVSFLALLILFICLLASVNKERADKFFMIFTPLTPVIIYFAEPIAKLPFIVNLTTWVNAYFLWEGVSANIEGNMVLVFFFAILCMLVSKCHDRLEGHKKSRENVRDANDHTSSTSSSSYEKLCKYFTDHVDDLSRQLDWSRMGTDDEHTRFTPVQAEVEMWAEDKPKRHYEDLVSCMKKKQKNKLFVVLGRPGSGKSVSLRELFRQLMDEHDERGRAPVYVNLKQWNESWNLNKLPDENDIIAFLKNSLFVNPEQNISKADISTELVKEYHENITQFEKLLLDGKWYFIFDSFDEIPCLMGQTTSQNLADELFTKLSDFLIKYGGGVIASRFYHSPSSITIMRSRRSDFNVITLRLQNFDEAHIQEMLKRYLRSSWHYVWDNLKTHQNLLILCQTPFYLAMLINCARENPDEIPPNQRELYKSFLGRNIQKSNRTENITIEEVMHAAQKLAELMQHPESYSNEYPLSKLGSSYRLNNRNIKWKALTDILCESRICRTDGNMTIAFSHRRFQEYFLIEGLLAKKWIVEESLESGREVYESILHNKGLRDALVLYCEASDDEQSVKRIAKFCRDVIMGDNKELNRLYFNYQSPQDATIEKRRVSIHRVGSLELVNILNFMSEAFYNKSQIMGLYQEDYENFLNIILEIDVNTILVIDNFLAIENLVSEPDEKFIISNPVVEYHSDLEILEAAVQSMRIFDQARLQKYAMRVFVIDNRWLIDIMMQNFRELKKLDPKIETYFCEYLRKRSVIPLFKRFRNTDVELSVAESFKTIRFFHGLNLLWFVSEFAVFILPLIYTILLLAGVSFPWEPNDLVTGWAYGQLDNISWSSIIIFVCYCSIIGNILTFSKHSFTETKKNNLTIILTFLDESFLLGIIKGVVFCLPTNYCLMYTNSILIISLITILYSIPFIFELIWKLHLRKIKYIYQKSQEIQSNFSFPLKFLRFVGFFIAFLLFLGLVDALLTKLFAAFPRITYITKIILCLILGFVCLLLLISVLSALLYGCKILMRIIYLPWHDRRWYNHRIVTPDTKKDRAKLANELYNIIKTNHWRRKYVKRLIDTNVSLTGSWREEDSNAPRPTFNDEILDHDLKELDMHSIRKEEEKIQKQSSDN